MRASKARLFLVLLRIGLEGGTNFTNQSQRTERQTKAAELLLSILD